ncbi:MAG: hypothetical protein LBD04_09500 [Synergistaceae bacterium]|jgi:hypothetical protein|nr:hypothetical protein [Synergistaceae bacterium]
MRKVVDFCVLSAMLVSFVAAGIAQADSSIFHSNEKTFLVRTGGRQQLSSHAE